MANALSQEKLNESSLLRIFWPRERCNLLRDDVVFVDSPGVDVSKNLDDWIDNHCVNADVFVLVLNAESTMTLAVGFKFSGCGSRNNLWLLLITGKVLFSHGVTATVQTQYLCAEQPMGCISQRTRIPRFCKYCAIRDFYWL